MDFPNGVTVSVQRPAGMDRFGNPKPSSTHTVGGCATAPAGYTAGFSEAHGTEATVEWDLDLMGPYDADFEAEDVVTLPGDTTRYQVHGHPQRYRSPLTGWEAGSVTRLKGVEG